MSFSNWRKNKIHSGRFIAGYFLLIIGLLSCEDALFFNKKDPIIAQVDERSLFLSQLADMVPDGTSKADSLAIVDGFIENWVRERLMIEEADKNIAADINLDKLVDDYRSSLLVYHYENKLTSRLLDTVVAEVEMREYYEMHKENYVLTHPTFRCILAKVPANASNLRLIRNALARTDLTEALFLIREKAVYHQIDTSMFMTQEDVESLLPYGMIKEGSLRPGVVTSVSDTGYEYFMRVLSYHDSGASPPFQYISDKIKKTILSERRIQLLKKYRQQLYEEGLDEKRVKIYKID